MFRFWLVAVCSSCSTNILVPVGSVVVGQPRSPDPKFASSKPGNKNKAPLFSPVGQKCSQTQNQIIKGKPTGLKLTFSSLKLDYNYHLGCLSRLVLNYGELLGKALFESLSQCHYVKPPLGICSSTTVKHPPRHQEVMGLNPAGSRALNLFSLFLCLYGLVVCPLKKSPECVQLIFINRCSGVRLGTNQA